MEQPIFVSGLFFKSPHPSAPDFVKGKLSIKVSELIPFIQQYQNNDYVNIDLLLSKEGKFYMKLDTWQPQQQQQTAQYPTQPQPQNQPVQQYPPVNQYPSTTPVVNTTPNNWQPAHPTSQYETPDNQYPQPDDIQVENIPF